ncbi:MULTISPECIES: hypothetical protein [unclassified Microbacterium]|uniref:hypothetical protein n=1 Tax=unclassified Microbacterium TaxID=2609290 RepID=UPI000EA92B7E|nr:MULTISPECIES: hypothetical protein [unclassified Microbacterium]MBT2484839.1 hypothetical protein [Microbacterium sp. ISL-108]RKN67709.1 hypothetical protein D7252_08980 [Microbacterium sp. CGR2]
MSLSPEGTAWDAYFEKYGMKGTGAKAKADQDESDETKFDLLETRLPLGELTGTQARIWSEAEQAGFELQGYSSLVHFYDKVQKTNGKTANAGDITKPAHDFRNIFIGGHLAKMKLRFHASWLESGFTAFVWDPVGRYMYANSRAEDERETHWVIRGSQEFELWIDEWRERFTGDSRRLEKERAEARKQARRDAIYQDYLDYQDGVGKYADEREEAA